ncbi:MAG: FAD-dependent oxidoreductase [Haliangium ochraceum]
MPTTVPGTTLGSPAGLDAPTDGVRAGPLVATLVARDTIAPGIVDLAFAMRSPDRLVFRAGQFVSIGVGKDTAGTSMRRSYSIASPTGSGDRLRFIIRAIAAGAASEFLLSLPMGAEVRMTGPHGFFVLDAEHPGDIVFGATGTGVAAVMPMLVELAQRDQRGSPAERGRRLLFWGVRHQADLFAVAEIEALCRQARCALTIFLSGQSLAPAPAPAAGWTSARGRITPAILDELPQLVSPTFYLVGNGAMIAELKAALIARGVNRKKQIRTEAFFD